MQNFNIMVFARSRTQLNLYTVPYEMNKKAKQDQKNNAYSLIIDDFVFLWYLHANELKTNGKTREC